VVDRLRLGAVVVAMPVAEIMSGEVRQRSLGNFLEFGQLSDS